MLRFPLHCRQAAKCLVGSVDAACEGFIADCIFAEPFWHVTLPPWPAVLPVPAVDELPGKVRELERQVEFYRAALHEVLPAIGPERRDELRRREAAALAEAAAEGRGRERVVMVLGPHCSEREIREASDALRADGSALEDVFREAYGIPVGAGVPRYSGDLERNFKWYHAWKSGRSVSALARREDDGVDRSHISRVVHTIDRFLTNGGPVCSEGGTGCGLLAGLEGDEAPRP